MRRRPGLTSLEPGAPPERGPRARPAGHLKRELAARWSSSQAGSHQGAGAVDVKILIARSAVHRLVTEMRGLQPNLLCENDPRRASGQMSKADLHCHSTASAVSRLGVQRALGLPECATPPHEVYELAKRRGMDFVTMTDHDTIDGALALAGLPDTFVSDELTAHFRGEPQAVHVLCLGITPAQWEWLAAHAGDVEECAEYLDASAIVSALAHPFYAVAAPLGSRHRRRLAELFPIWETRNGSRAPELNMPAAIYVETNGGTAIGGSDDHAGIDIGRTFTQTPHASTPGGVPRAPARRARSPRRRAGLDGEVGARGDGADRARARPRRRAHAGRPGARAGDGRAPALARATAREGAAVGGVAPADARALLRAWLASVDLDHLSGVGPRRLHAGRALHARRPAAPRDPRARAAPARRGRDGARRRRGAARSPASAGRSSPPASRRSRTRPRPRSSRASARSSPAATASSRASRSSTDGIGAMHGVTRTIEEIRERGIAGFEIEVIGTDRNVDRRLPAVADVEIPHYPGMTLGVPSLPAVVEAITGGRYDADPRVLARTQRRRGGAARARDGDPARRQLPHRARRVRRAALRRPDARVGGQARDRRLLRAVPARALAESRGRRRARRARDHDATRRALGPRRRCRAASTRRGVASGRFPGAFNVLYAGRITSEKNIDLLADAFVAAHAADSRLHLVLAGGGPEQPRLAARLGARATFLGWLEGDALAAAYASADAFCFPSETDTFGQVVLEAQASGLPVVAVDAGGPRELIDDGVDGLLRRASPRRARDRAARTAADPRRCAAARRRRARQRRGAHLGASARTARGRLPRGAAPRRRDGGPRCRVRAVSSRSPCTTSSRRRSSARR